MPVNTLHPLYMKRKSQWETMRDCIEGEDAIKSKGEKYLPKACGWDRQEYDNYKARARFVNFTKRTLEGLHGLVFRRAPVVETPEDGRLKDFVKNVDMRGSTLYQFLSDNVYDSMITGFGGIMADMPRVSRQMNLLEAQEEGIRPYLRYYPAESIINWDYGNVKGFEQLTLVVLLEKMKNPECDEFEHDTINVFRILELKDGVYQQRVSYDEGNTYETIPVSIGGRELDYIPFAMIPGKEPDVPMFYDLVKCNIGHYQKTADYENGVHLTTISTGFITGHEQQIDEETGEPESIHLGRDRFILVKEPDAKVGNMSFAGAGLTHSEKALEMDMSNMAILGSRLVTPEKGTSESADSAKIHRAGENARLATFAKNISEEMTRVMNIIIKWLGIEGESKISLCTDYDTLAFDPNAINSIANLSEAEKMPLPYIFFNLKNGEYVPDSSTLEEYVALLELEKSGASLSDIITLYREFQHGRKNKISESSVG